MNENEVFLDEREPEAADGDLLAELVSMAPDDLDVPATTAARAETKLREVWRRELRRRRRPRLGLGLAAAAALVLAVAGRLLLPTPSTLGNVTRVTSALPSGLAVGDPIMSGTTLVSGRSAVAVAVAGGGELRIAPETTLRFAGDRIDLENGAVYLDTEPGRTSALVIRTGWGDVQHVGTRYEVRAGPERLRVRVRDGRVAVTTATVTATAEAGDELTVNAEGRVDRRRVSPYGEEWSWVLAAAPGIDLQDRPLRDYLAWLQRETGWTVQLAGADLERDASEITLVGSTVGLRPDATPAIVLPACDLGFRLEDGTLVIEKPPSPPPP